MVTWLTLTLFTVQSCIVLRNYVPTFTGQYGSNRRGRNFEFSVASSLAAVSDSGGCSAKTKSSGDKAGSKQTFLPWSRLSHFCSFFRLLSFIRFSSVSQHMRLALLTLAELMLSKFSSIKLAIRAAWLSGYRLSKGLLGLKLVSPEMTCSLPEGTESLQIKFYSFII